MGDQEAGQSKKGGETPTAEPLIEKRTMKKFKKHRSMEGCCMYPGDQTVCWGIHTCNKHTDIGNRMQQMEGMAGGTGNP